MTVDGTRKSRTFQLTDREFDLLAKWGAEQDRSRTGMIRQLIREEEERRREVASEAEAA